MFAFSMLVTQLAHVARPLLVAPTGTVIEAAVTAVFAPFAVTARPSGSVAVRLYAVLAVLFALIAVIAVDLFVATGVLALTFARTVSFALAATIAYAVAVYAFAAYAAAILAFFRAAVVAAFGIVVTAV